MQVRISAESTLAGWPGRYISVQRYGRLSMVLLKLKDPLEQFVRRREFIPGSWFLPCCDMTLSKV